MGDGNDGIDADYENGADSGNSDGKNATSGRSRPARLPSPRTMH
jgi:hypothetical protein